MPWSPRHHTCHVAVPLTRCMNHAMEPLSPHAPCRRAPRSCTHHIITICSMFSSFFFLLTSSFVFQPLCSNGTMVMTCGHEDAMDNDRRCSTMWRDATHHNHNTTRHNDCDHDSMQHNNPNRDHNTTHDAMPATLHDTMPATLHGAMPAIPHVVGYLQHHSLCNAHDTTWFNAHDTSCGATPAILHAVQHLRHHTWCDDCDCD